MGRQVEPSATPDGHQLTASPLPFWGLISKILTGGCALLSLLALADLAVRAAVRLEVRWDTFDYHLPFAALRGGLHIPYEMNENRMITYQGFPPLPYLVQGILWRLTESVNATGVVSYLAFLVFLVYGHIVLRARFWLVSLIALTAPLVIIHATASYVDLFGNSLLAIGISSCLCLYLFPERPSRLVTVGGLCGLVGAAWSKYLLVPIVAVGFCLFAVVCMRRSRKDGFSRRQTALIILAAVLVAASPYLKNLALYGNPFWPIRMPVMAQMFPYEIEVADHTRTQRPPPLRESSQGTVFVHSLLEIGHPTRYDYRARWIIDQGNAWEAYRAGGFWVVGVVTYLLVTIIMLLVNHRKAGLVASLGVVGIVGVLAILPQSNELRYYMFLPLCWAAAVGMLFPAFKERAPRVAPALLALVVGLFVYMVSENRGHYRIEKMNWVAAAQLWGASEWWGKLQRGQTYCVVDMVPIGILMTGPTLSEYSIIDRSNAALCPDGTIVVTKDGIRPKTPANGPQATGSPATVKASGPAETLLDQSLQHYLAGRFTECLDTATHSATLNPNSAQAFNNIGICAASLQLWDEAVRNTQEALRLAPGFQLARNNLAWIQQQRLKSDATKGR